jgi:hypothetical protein
MGALTTAYILNIDISAPLYWATFGMAAFYLAHWQEYFCHYLELGYFNGPTEAEVFAILIYVITGFTGSCKYTNSISSFSRSSVLGNPNKPGYINWTNS